jgi:hypothetical protein
MSNALLSLPAVVGEDFRSLDATPFHFPAECPAPQSYEFWHALKTLGVPSQLVVYPSDGNLFIKRSNQTCRLDQTVA